MHFILVLALINVINVLLSLLHLTKKKLYEKRVFKALDKHYEWYAVKEMNFFKSTARWPDVQLATKENLGDSVTLAYSVN